MGKIYVREYYLSDELHNKYLEERIRELERYCCLLLAVSHETRLSILVRIIDSVDNECCYSCRISNSESMDGGFEADAFVEGETAIGSGEVSLPSDFEYDLFFTEISVEGKTNSSMDSKLCKTVKEIGGTILKRFFNGTLYHFDD